MTSNETKDNRVRSLRPALDDAGTRPIEKRFRGLVTGPFVCSDDMAALSVHCPLRSIGIGDGNDDADNNRSDSRVREDCDGSSAPDVGRGHVCSVAWATCPCLRDETNPHTGGSPVPLQT